MTRRRAARSTGTTVRFGDDELDGITAALADPDHEVWADPVTALDRARRAGFDPEPTSPSLLRCRHFQTFRAVRAAYARHRGMLDQSAAPDLNALGNAGVYAADRSRLACPWCATPGRTPH